MSVPGFQDFMLPLVQIAADGQEHSVADTSQILAKMLNISDEDRNEMLPSGNQTRFSNRLSWSIVHLSKSLLLEKTGVLLDGQQLADLMIDHGVGVTNHKVYTIRRIDSDYLEPQ